MGYDSMTSSRERKILLDEPAPGQDMVYDGAANMTSIAYLMDKQKERHTNGSSWVTPQNYSTPFKSKTPRPFQHNKFPITAQANKFPILGPGQYNLPVGEKESQHLFSASVSWQSRGRAGPVGFPFDASRRSSQFSSTLGRFGLASQERRRRTVDPLPEDIFLVKSAFRKADAIRNDFCSQLQMRTLNWDTFSTGGR